jgi:formamidopyrimidine-DNA glycosylase
MEWTMTFNGKGRLLKATHARAPQLRAKAVQKIPVEVQGKPVQAADPDAKAILIR